MIHPPNKDESHLNPHGNPQRLKFKPKRFSGCLAKGGFGALLTDGADYPDGGFAQEAGFA